MASLRRILKSTPAVVMVVMIVAWLASLTAPFALRIQYPGIGTVRLAVSHGNLNAVYFDSFSGFSAASVGFEREPLSRRPLSYCVGRVGYRRILATDADVDLHIADFSILFAITLVGPLAIGPFLSFRFRLWHYLAFTAIVALELAYYFRWQE